MTLKIIKYLVKNIFVLMVLSSAANAASDKCVDLFKTAIVFSPEIKNSTLKFKLTADFSKALLLAKNDDPYAPGPAEALLVPMTLTDSAGHIFTGHIKARGHSILSDPDVDFPKIEVIIDKSTDLSVSDISIHSFRINTHLSEKTPASGLSGYGRKIGDAGPLREGLLYKLAEVLNLIAPQTQFADINYINSEAKTDETHKALIIEKDKKLAKRLNADLIDDISELQKPDQPLVGLDDAALIMVFHKLIGNEDFNLKMYDKFALESEKNRNLWNTFLLKTSNGNYKPVVYDLDLSTAVTGVVADAYSTMLNSSFKLTSADEAQFVVRFSELKQRLGKAELLRAVHKVLSLKNELLNTIKQSPTDVDGKKLAYRQLEIFENWALKVLDFQIIGDTQTQFYSRPDGRSHQKLVLNSFDGKPVALRPGTPIHILEDLGKYLKVEILDVRHDLKDNESTIGYIKKSAILSQDLPISLLGWVEDRDL